MWTFYETWFQSLTVCWECLIFNMKILFLEFDRDLEKDVQSETSGHFRKFLTSLTQVRISWFLHCGNTGGVCWLACCLSCHWAPTLSPIGRGCNWMGDHLGIVPCWLSNLELMWVELLISPVLWGFFSRALRFPPPPP